MDTLIFLVSAAVVVTLGYGVFWTVRAVHRAGLRRFSAALGALVLAVMAAAAKLFSFKIDGARASRDDRRDDFIHVIEDLRIAREHQRLSEEGTLNPPSHE